MRTIDGLLAELDQEAITTARVLERVPQAQLSWRPHPKSWSLGQLALHVATVPGLVAELAAIDTVPEPSKFVQTEAETTTELAPALSASIARARQLLGGFDDERMNTTWRLMHGQRQLLAMPRAAFVGSERGARSWTAQGRLLPEGSVPTPSVWSVPANRRSPGETGK